MSIIIKSTLRFWYNIIISQFRHIRSNGTNPPIGVSTLSVEPKWSTSKPNADANADDMKEWDAPVSKRADALELNTSNVPRTTDSSRVSEDIVAPRLYTCNGTMGVCCPPQENLNIGYFWPLGTLGLKLWVVGGVGGDGKSGGLVLYWGGPTMDDASCTDCL